MVKRRKKWRERLCPKAIALIGLFGLISLYAVYRTKDLMAGPALFIDKASAATREVNQPLFDLKGEAKRIARLFLNNKQIYTDEDGNFEEKVLLAPGYNLLKLVAQDKFGRGRDYNLEVIYHQWLIN